MESDTERSDRQKRKRIIKTAQKYIGTKYRTGGKTPRGFDCSGFSSYVFSKNNIKLGANSSSQSLQGHPVKIKDLQPGDLIFFGSKKRINHVGIVTKQSRKELRMIHASSSRGIIEEDITNSSYWQKRIVGGRRVI
ncbi:hypothetical protein GCM10007940_37950 [Portibacter lacus]|uniref:NlpC/P60 domain-containing protein n=2 Tax=Portibacter lacus TaxID=1099794 RepID=A0AA37SSU2_9BACT|nr:hypothetical protein GCM10007940_37950 [Portibacter lacus]